MNQFYPKNYQYEMTPDIVDESGAGANPGITYLGFWSGGANLGNATAQAKFQIRKITVNSGTGITLTEFADGSGDFNKVWDARAGYNYMFLR
jgi:hypothetical protein